MTLQEWLAATRQIKIINKHEYQDIRPMLVCNNGTKMSVQASDTHYSTPRNNDGPYRAVEMWCLSGQTIPALGEYGDGEDPWAFVPVEVIEELITFHGGISADTPLTHKE